MNFPDTLPRNEFFQSLWGDFLEHSGPLLERLSANLLCLDQWLRSLDEGASARCDDQLLNEMFHAVHGLNGLSAVLGLKEIHRLAHPVENVLEAVRKEDLRISGEVVELLFQALDRLGSLVEMLKEPSSAPVDYEGVLREIQRVLEDAGAASPAASSGDRSAPTTALPVSPPTPDTAIIDSFAVLSDETEPAAKYLSIFIDEAEISLDQMTETLLALDAGDACKAAEQLMVGAHRIKGEAAALGLQRAAKLAHLMEDHLQAAVSAQRAIPDSVADALLACTEGLRDYVQSLKRGRPHTEQFPRLAQGLLAAQPTGEGLPDSPVGGAQNAVAPRTAGTAAERTPAEEEKTPSADRLADAWRDKVFRVTRQSDRENTYVGTVVFQDGLPLAGLKGRLIYEKLSNVGEIRLFDPPEEALEELELLAGITFGVTSEKSADEIRRAARVAGIAQFLLEPLIPPEQTPEGEDLPVAAACTSSSASVAENAPPQRRIERDATPISHIGNAPTSPSRPDKGSPKPTETLRVDVERLDHLMDLVGQLIIHRAHFAEIAERMKQMLEASQFQEEHVVVALSKWIDHDGAAAEGNASAEGRVLHSQARRIRHDFSEIGSGRDSFIQIRAAVHDLEETVHQLQRVAEGLQHGVMETRMIPVGPLFHRFKRVIRDLARTSGKEIQLTIHGERTELDKRMIDELGDPLIHLIRNAVDHGIEPPAVREAAGKPRQGAVTLSAFHRGNRIYLRVSDDGWGLDAERIRDQAVEKGLLAAAEAQGLTPSQIYPFIWASGFSTAETVTEISGRGVGMDIVKAKIDELSGTAELESIPGRGTTITLKLPLTLAILPSLLVVVGDEVFALPLESVEEIVHVTAKDLRPVHRQCTALVRDRVISVFWLEELFDGAAPAAGPTVDSSALTLVIVGAPGQELGVIVDRVLGKQDIVIKSLAENFRNVPGVAGASILGDGRVSLILDAVALIERASRKNVPAGKETYETAQSR